MNHTTEPNLFIVKDGNTWMKQARLTPTPQQLFGPLWYENEVCILFADTNVGKSILACQIGNAVAHGRILEKCDSRHLAVGPLTSRALPRRVAYVDFELSDRQWSSRYSQHDGKVFSDNFFRCEVNTDATVVEPERVEAVWQGLDDLMAECRPEAIVIDNITYMASETETAKFALPLMKRIKELRNKYKISILLIAHTPKRDSSQPLTRNDMQGSKMLINFCDSAFTIGESSREPQLRYIKQIKCRQQEMIFHESNVVLCTLKKDVGSVYFSFVGYGKESDHLFTFAANRRNGLKSRAITLSRQGRSLRQIGRELGVSRMTVSRWLDAENPKERCHILPVNRPIQ